MNVKAFNDCAMTWLWASPVLYRPSRYVTPGVASADHLHVIVVGSARVQIIVIAVGIGPWTGEVVVVAAIVVVEVELVVVGGVVVVAGLVVVAANADVVDVAASGGAVVVAAAVVVGLNTEVGGGAAVVGTALVTAVDARVVEVEMRGAVVVGIALTGVVRIGRTGVDVDATTGVRGVKLLFIAVAPEEDAPLLGRPSPMPTPAVALRPTCANHQD